MIPGIPLVIFQKISPSLIVFIRSLFERSAGFLRSFGRFSSLPAPVSPWQKTQLPCLFKNSSLPLARDSSVASTGFIVLSASAGRSQVFFEKSGVALGAASRGIGLSIRLRFVVEF